MRYLIVMAALLASLTCSAREVASEEGKIESMKNGKEKVYDYDKYTVVPRAATQAYLDKMKRLKELEEENSKLREENEQLRKRSQIDKVVVEKATEEPQRNSLSLLGGAATTGMSTESSPTTFKVSTQYEPDLGLMYQHDFDDFRGSAAATLRGNLYLGIGLRF